MYGDSSDHRWVVEIFEVLDHHHQQQVLELFRDIGRPDVSVLGTQDDRGWFIVVETSTSFDRIFARHIVMKVDPHATSTYLSKPPKMLGPTSVS